MNQAMDSIHGTQTLGAPKLEIICRRQWILFIETRAWEPPSRPAGDHAPMLESDGSCYRSNKKNENQKNRLRFGSLQLFRVKKDEISAFLNMKRGKLFFTSNDSFPERKNQARAAGANYA
jgi:hypothetical protein